MIRRSAAFLTAGLKCFNPPSITFFNPFNVEGLKKLKSQNPDQYRSPLSSSASSAPTGLEKALLALEFVNERAVHLASTIKKSLTLLPNSPVSIADPLSLPICSSSTLSPPLSLPLPLPR